ncbi:glycerophosphodiester phosphodiesterase family protein [Streptomyces sp. NPDC007325]|uniref:glycerophosphodiester phosphodiesterase n=1 Tax=Streptomyces sp. NPDC007325 TaxID=3154588 RepID=UPI0033FF92EB
MRPYTTGKTDGRANGCTTPGSILGRPSAIPVGGAAHQRRATGSRPLETTSRCRPQIGSAIGLWDEAEGVDLGRARRPPVASALDVVGSRTVLGSASVTPIRGRRRRVAAVSVAALATAVTAAFLVTDRDTVSATASVPSVPEVIAHRGASAVAPENTLISGEVARRAGADWIENDVRPSRDGGLYVFHDATVDRTTDGKGHIGKLTSAEIDALDAGSWFAPEYKGVRIPTLAAQLADLRERGGKLLLDITGTRGKADIERIIQTVRDEGMMDRVMVQSFFPESLKHVRKLAPQVPMAFLQGKLDADPVAVAKDLDVIAYNVSDEALKTRPEVVKDLHAAGVKVNVWTVDDPKRWSELADLGVDGIITDKATELVGWNAARAGDQ